MSRRYFIFLILLVLCSFSVVSFSEAVFNAPDFCVVTELNVLTVALSQHTITRTDMHLIAEELHLSTGENSDADHNFTYTDRITLDVEYDSADIISTARIHCSGKEAIASDGTIVYTNTDLLDYLIYTFNTRTEHTENASVLLSDSEYGHWMIGNVEIIIPFLNDQSPYLDGDFEIDFIRHNVQE